MELSNIIMWSNTIIIIRNNIIIITIIIIIIIIIIIALIYSAKASIINLFNETLWLHINFNC